MSANPAVPAPLKIMREESRRTIFEAIGDSPDITYFAGIGNIGDALIQAGNERLLAPLRPRRAPLTEIPFRRGHTAVLSGGGAWCAPYHEIMPHALREAERRFEQVVVLPSSFDVSVPAVREALIRSSAHVIAREPESFHQIRSLCASALALDAAFFFDFDPYRRPGNGVLHAYRTDRESAGDNEIPSDNDDISATCRTLDEWLERIGRHAVVRTDRAHVMIAAALLGKGVEYRPSLYHKLPAIADFALREYPVRRSLPRARPPVLRRSPVRETPDRESLRARIRARALANGVPLASGARESARVTVVLLSWNRPAETLRALASLRENVRLPWNLCLVDNGSDAEVAATIADEARRVPGAELHLLTENRGCAGGRAYALERVTTEFAMFLDDDAEVFPETVERLVAELDSHPEALGVTGEVVLPDGLIHHFGGRIVEEGPIVRFLLQDAGRPFDDPEASENGSCDWVPGTCAVFRTAAFLAQPLDPGMRAYFEDNEWCFRVGLPGAFRRAVGAFALHHHEPKVGAAGGGAPSDVVEFVRAIAQFFARHGRILEVLFHIVPGLRRGDGSPDIAAARIFLETAERDGADAFVLRWIGDGLAPLLHRDAEVDNLRRNLAESRARARALESRLTHLEGRYAELARTLPELHAELKAFTGSRFGRMAAFYWRLRSSLPRRRSE